MRRWVAPFLLTAVCLAVGTAATALAEGKGKFVLERLNEFRRPPAPTEQPPPPGGPGRPQDRAGDHLAHADDSLTLAALALKGEDGARRQGPVGPARLGAGVLCRRPQGLQGRRYDRADEMAHAADAAAHGILMTLQADAGKLVNVTGEAGSWAGAAAPPPPGGRDGPPPPREGRDGPPPPAPRRP